MSIEFKGAGIEEIALVVSIEGDKAPALKVGDVIMRINPRYFRPAEVDTLLGDPSRQKKKLDGFPKLRRKKCVQKWSLRTTNQRKEMHYLRNTD